MMGQLRTAIQAYARLDLPPGQVMRHLDAIVRDTGGSQIVTCVYAVFDPRDHVLTVANAGHLPPVMLHPGDEPPLLLPAAGGPPLGAGPWPYVEERIPMVDGARLVLYTDGLVEQRGVDIDDGLAALLQLLATDVGSVDGLPARIIEELLPDGSDDDVALLVAQLRLPVGETVLSERLPDSHRAPGVARRHLADGLRNTAVPDELIDDVALVATELVTNAIRYGEPPYDLHVRLHASGVVIEVWDSSLVEPMPRPAGPEDEAGRGLLIVEGLADSWGTRRSGTRKAVWCLISRPHDASQD
jgi:anti-sigma regulatory factor (Ser/Thr protein kinase)